MSEAVAALAEASLKASDVPAALDVCAALHARHADFADQLVPALLKAFTAKAATGDLKRPALPSTVCPTIPLCGQLFRRPIEPTWQ